VGFDFEVTASLLKHGRLSGVPDPTLGRYPEAAPFSVCISGTEADNMVNGGGGIGGTGANFIADCEQGRLELRFELRIGIEMWLL
jgi:hypothetical protein